IVELGDIAAHHPHLLAEIAVVRGLRVDVHADDLLAALGEERDKTPPDKAGAADDEDGHARLSLVANAVQEQPRAPSGQMRSLLIGMAGPRAGPHLDPRRAGQSRWRPRVSPSRSRPEKRRIATRSTRPRRGLGCCVSKFPQSREFFAIYRGF